MTARENPQAAPTGSVRESVIPSHSKNLPFCPPKICLYYAGDFDSSNSNANALLNVDGGGSYGYTYVGVKPAQSVSVTGATFNELLSGGFIGDNPTPFEVRENMSAGQGGNIVCNTTGSAAMAAYGESDFGYVQYSYTIKKLAKPCPLRKGKVYFVSLVLITQNGIGYVVDVEDSPAPNHKGWKNVLDDSFFSSNLYGTPYEPTWGSSGACDGTGCDAFSIALTGKKIQ